MQGLLEDHMGMSIQGMQQFTDGNQGLAQGRSLPGARLPQRGFYRIQSVAANQIQKRKGPDPCSFRGLSWLGAKGSKTGPLERPSEAEGSSDTMGKTSLSRSSDDVIRHEQESSIHLAEVKMPLEI